ncbi:MAG: site-specific integrase [Lachnospira sp.]|nr:site-specific integrase [Lachnospira sp.]
MEFEKVWTAFAETLKPNTAAKYRITFDEFSRFTGKTFPECTDADVLAYEKYLNSMENNHKITHSTHYTKISVLRSLANFVEKCGFYDNYKNPFSMALVERNSLEIDNYTIPQLEDLEILLRAAKDNIRDYLIFVLVMKCALNTRQICMLTVDDILNYNDHLVLSVFYARNNNKHHISLPQDVENILIKYLENFQSEGSLFLNSRKKPLKERDLQRLLKKYIMQVKDSLYKKDFTIAEMRHAGIIYMMAGGADSADISSYVGLTDSARLKSRYKRAAAVSLNNPAEYSILSVHG